MVEKEATSASPLAFVAEQLASCLPKKIFATEEFYYGAFLNETLARDEIEEVFGGVRGGMRQHVQTDETTWGAAKCGRGKPGTSW